MSSKIISEPFSNKEVIIVHKQKQTYYFQYTVKEKHLKYIFHSQVEYKIGTTLLLEGEVTPFNNQTIPYGFHPKEYYFSHGIIGKLMNIKVIDVHEKYTLRELLYEFKGTYKDSELEPFMDAFIFDDQRELQTFSADWLLYLFSVSGLHMYVLSQLIISLFKVRQMKHQLLLRLFIVLPFFIFQPFHFSLIRLFFMYLITLLLLFSRFQIPKYVILGFIWIMIIIIQPYRVYDIGLFISFFLVMLIYISSHHKTHSVIQQYHIILIATFLIFLFNGRIMLLPVLMMPIIIFAVIYTIFMPTLLMFILQVEIQFLMDWFYKIFEVFTIIHRYSSMIQLPRFPNFFVSLAFIIVFSIHLSSSKKVIIQKTLILFFTLFILGKIIVVSQPPRLIFLDVGQGDSTIYIDKNCVVVIDAFANVEAYLRNQGREHIDYLFLTHSDLDHVKEAKSLIENMNVHHVITSPFQEIDGIQTTTVYQFPQIYVCGEIKINLLGPKESMFNDNDDSLILLIDFLGKKILFTGDASKERENKLISILPKDIDVLKIGHHGSKTSTSPELLYALKPEFGIISTSINNRYGMPHQEVIDTLNTFQVKLFITSIDGSIEMTIFEGEIKWENYPP